MRRSTEKGLPWCASYWVCSVAAAGNSVLQSTGTVPPFCIATISRRTSTPGFRSEGEWLRGRRDGTRGCEPTVACRSISANWACRRASSSREASRDAASWWTKSRAKRSVVARSSARSDAKGSPTWGTGGGGHRALWTLQRGLLLGLRTERRLQLLDSLEGLAEEALDLPQVRLCSPSSVLGLLQLVQGRGGLSTGHTRSRRCLAEGSGVGRVLEVRLHDRGGAMAGGVAGGDGSEEGLGFR